MYSQFSLLDNKSIHQVRLSSDRAHRLECPTDGRRAAPQQADLRAGTGAAAAAGESRELTILLGASAVALVTLLLVGGTATTSRHWRHRGGLTGPRQPGLNPMRRGASQPAKSETLPCRALTASQKGQPFAGGASDPWTSRGRVQPTQVPIEYDVAFSGARRQARGRCQT